jgi:hypothetical protein
MSKTKYQDDHSQRFLKTYPEDKDRTILNKLIYFKIKKRLQIPDNKEIQLESKEHKYNSKVAVHFGQRETLKVITLSFYGT